jgi:hypothetical protein
MKKTKCKFCNSLRCHTRIISEDKTYDEIACDKHIHDLESDSDKILGSHNGVMRTHISSSMTVKRGELVS